MTDWFRAWHGAPTDPKWRTIARRANSRPGDVFAVVSCLWDRASQARDRGSVAGYDCEIIADGLGYEPDEVERIISALIDKEVIIDGRIAAWEKYQPKREDNQSTERSRRFRDKNHETETTESQRDETQCNAMQRAATLDTETEEKREEEKKEEQKTSRAVAAATRPAAADKFEEFWREYPKREGANPRKPAEKRFKAALRSGIDADEIIDGTKRFSIECQRLGKTGTPYVPQALKWLGECRWADYPPPTAPPIEAFDAPERPPAPIGWRPGLPTREELLERERMRREGGEKGKVDRGSDCVDTEQEVAPISPNGASVYRDIHGGAESFPSGDIAGDAGDA